MSLYIKFLILPWLQKYYVLKLCLLVYSNKVDFSFSPTLNEKCFSVFQCFKFQIDVAQPLLTKTKIHITANF